MQWNINLRPKVLSEVYGADAVKDLLYNSAKNKSWPVAMHFLGNTGCGKTTVAQIAAKMIVCKNPKPNGDPCCECPACKAVDDQTFNREVVLINASDSSNKGELRPLMEAAVQPSMYGKEKVIIIDEAQALSDSKRSDSQSLLLKFLESPRPGIHWILTSTEPLTNGAAIGRLMLFKFNPFYPSEIAKYLLELFEHTTDTESGRTYLDILGDNFDSMEEVNEWLNYVSDCANGSIRNAVVLSEQCFKTGIFKVEGMKKEFGVTSKTDVYNILNAVANNIKTPEVFRLVESFMSRSAVNSNAAMESTFQGMLWLIANAECFKTFKQLPADCESSWTQNRVDALLKAPNYEKLKNKIIELSNRPYLNASLVTTELLGILADKPNVAPTRGSVPARGNL